MIFEMQARWAFSRLFTIAVMLLLVNPARAQSTVSAGDATPNIIVIFTDDLGYGDVGVYGAQDFDTPHLDRMADEGIRFTDFYVAAPVCTPSRAALMTGSYPKRVGLAYRVLFPYSETGLHPDEITIAEVLQEQGYATAAIGKWHLGHQDKFLPTNQGFDYYYGIPYSNDMGSHRYEGRNFTSPPLPLMRNEEVIEESPAQASLTGRYTEEALRFIEANQDHPFFLYLPHSMPHLPIDASEQFKGESRHGLYGDVVEEIDGSVGQILEALDKYEIDDNTLVVFTSDNGPVIRSEERLGHRPGSAGPLRGHKNTTWEGGMRVPCIMRWPGQIPAGAVSHELATTMDFMPTFARLAGADAPGDRVVDGKDIRSLMFDESGAESPYVAFYYYRDDRLQAVRSGRWKLHTYRPAWGRNNYMETPAPLLYDLQEDAGETTNVAGEHPDVVRKLQALANQARRELGDGATSQVGHHVRPVGTINE